MKRAIRAPYLVAIFALGLIATSDMIADSDPVVAAPEEHRRPADQTFLTFPEWYLVHSPAEYASFIKDQPPSLFPFIGHIGQFWSSYGAVYGAIRNEYPFNWGYHVMIMVIGVSTTVEYSLKSAYETLIGRLTELNRANGMTEEDEYAAFVAQDYVDFIRAVPWYEYDFWGRLTGLWTETSFFGSDMLRKLERKYTLTSEFVVKAVYGWLIKSATQAGYEAPLPVTTVLVKKLPAAIEKDLPELVLLEGFPDETILITVPRYAAFRRYVMSLASGGARFLEIAGNRSNILVTVLVPAPWEQQFDYYDVLFTQPILTRPSTKRIAITVPIASLHRVLEEFGSPPLYIEHVYDF